MNRSEYDSLMQLRNVTGCEVYFEAMFQNGNISTDPTGLFAGPEDRNSVSSELCFCIIHQCEWS